MKTKLVIFDLDGTLLDTINDLALSVNHVLQKQGYPTHSVEQYKYFVGNGVEKLIERALPADRCTEELVSWVQEAYFAYYADHGQDHTKPYQGIMELLGELSKRDIALAVASNKHHSATVDLIEHYFGKNTFCAILGKRKECQPKPDPTIVYDIVKMCGVTNDDVLYVGDSGTDMLTAANASVCSVGVTWGFRTRDELEQHGANHIIDSPMELLDLTDAGGEITTPHLRQTAPHAAG